MDWEVESRITIPSRKLIMIKAKQPGWPRQHQHLRREPLFNTAYHMLIILSRMLMHRQVDGLMMMMMKVMKGMVERLE